MDANEPTPGPDGPGGLTDRAEAMLRLAGEPSSPMEYLLHAQTSAMIGLLRHFEATDGAVGLIGARGSTSSTSEAPTPSTARRIANAANAAASGRCAEWISNPLPDPGSSAGQLLKAHTDLVNIGNLSLHPTESRVGSVVIRNAVAAAVDVSEFHTNARQILLIKVLRSILGCSLAVAKKISDDIAADSGLARYW